MPRRGTIHASRRGTHRAYAAVHVTMTLADLRRFTGAKADPGIARITSVFTRREPPADQDLFR